MSEKYTPHFDEATIGQELTNVHTRLTDEQLKQQLLDDPGYEDNPDYKIGFSLLQFPTTFEHMKGMPGRTERIPTPEFIVDIDIIRKVEKETLERISEEYSERHVFKGEEGLKVGSRIVNSHANEGTIGLMTSWSTDADWINTKGIVEALALTFPDKKIVFIETPGMGDSDRLSWERINNLVDKGSFGPMAEQIAACLKPENTEFDVLVGVSEGSRAVISLAEIMGVKTVVTLDPPGTHEQSFATFGKHFMIDEQSAQGQVLKNSPDETMAKAHKSTDSKILAKNAIRQPIKTIRNQLLFRAWSMAKAGLITDVKTACDSGVEVYDYRHGASTFASAEIMAELASETPGYNSILLPNAPHGINEGNPFAVSQLVKQALTLKASFEPKDESVEAAKRIIANN